MQLVIEATTLKFIGQFVSGPLTHETTAFDRPPGIRGHGTVSALPRYQATANGVHMDREHIKGAADKVKGAIKEAAGKMTGDKELQSEGKLDKAKGEAHNIAGNIKD